MRLILLHLLKRYEFSLTDKQNTRYVQEDMSYNTFTGGPRNIYNELMEDSNKECMFLFTKEILNYHDYNLILIQINYLYKLITYTN